MPTEGQLRDSKLDKEKEIKELDRTIEELESKKKDIETVQNSLREDVKGATNESERDAAQKRLAEYDAQYRQNEAELRRQNTERASKAKEDQNLQTEITKRAAQRKKTFGDEVKKIEQLAEGSSPFRNLKNLADKTGPDNGVSADASQVVRQYSRASCYRGDLIHYWEHVSDLAAVTPDGLEEAKKLFKSDSRTLTDKLLLLDSEMRSFEYGDPDSLSRTVQDVAQEAQSLRDTLESRMDARGDRSNPSGETTVDSLVADSLEGMMFSVATHLNTLAQDGRLKQCGEGYSVTRALREAELSFAKIVVKNLESTDYRTLEDTQQERLDDNIEAYGKLDKCWEHMTSPWLETTSKQIRKELEKLSKRAKMAPSLKAWSKTKSQREIKRDKLMKAASDVLVTFQMYQEGIGKIRVNLFPGPDGEFDNRTLLDRDCLSKLELVGGVFLRSIARDAGLLVESRRV